MLTPFFFWCCRSRAICRHITRFTPFTPSHAPLFRHGMIFHGMPPYAHAALVLLSFSLLPSFSLLFFCFSSPMILFFFSRRVSFTWYLRDIIVPARFFFWGGRCHEVAATWWALYTRIFFFARFLWDTKRDDDAAAQPPPQEMIWYYIHSSSLRRFTIFLPHDMSCRLPLAFFCIFLSSCSLLCASR